MSSSRNEPGTTDKTDTTDPTQKILLMAISQLTAENNKLKDQIKINEHKKKSGKKSKSLQKKLNEISEENSTLRKDLETCKVQNQQLIEENARLRQELKEVHETSDRSAKKLELISRISSNKSTTNPNLVSKLTIFNHLLSQSLSSSPSPTPSEFPSSSRTFS